VKVDLTMACPGKSLRGVNVAAGAAGVGYVTFAGTNTIVGRLATVAATGDVSFEEPPMLNTIVLVDAAGVPSVVGDSGGGLKFYRVDAQGWWGEQVTSPPSFTSYRIVAARFTAGGQAHVAHYVSDGFIRLATRDTAGGWTQTDVVQTRIGSLATLALAIDAVDRPHVVFQVEENKTTLTDWRPGVAASTAAFLPVTYPVGAAPSGDSIAMSGLTAGGIRVLVPQPGSAARDMTLPGTPALVISGCPLVSGASGTVPPTPCTETGDGVTAHALAATPEGLWIAYIQFHVDRDAVQHCEPFEDGAPIQCHKDVKADRSTARLLLARVPTDASSSPAIVWQRPIDTNQADAVSLDARQSQLSLAVFPNGFVLPSIIQYLAFDATAF